jgi:hypothetical protein
MKSDAATIANILAPEPRILSNIAKRSKNTKIECNVSDSQDLVKNGDALYVMLHQKQSDLQDISSAFQKLFDRLKRNGRTMLSGKTGEIFNKFSQSIGLGQDKKYVICFHDPNKAIKLTRVKEDSQKLANIHVAASNLKLTEGSLQSIQPVETIVGKDKTTSFCPKMVKLVQTYSKNFGNNGLVLFEMKTQRLGYAEATRDVLLSLTTTCFNMFSSFDMNYWQKQDYLFNFKNLNMESTQTDGEINFAFNASKQHFGNLETYFHGPSTPYVEEALAYHETKRNKNIIYNNHVAKLTLSHMLDQKDTKNLVN